MKTALWIFLGCVALSAQAHAQTSSDCAQRCTQSCVKQADATDTHAPSRCALLCQKACQRRILRCHRRCEMQNIRALRGCNVQTSTQQDSCRLAATKQRHTCKQACPMLPPKPVLSARCTERCTHARQRASQRCVTLPMPSRRKACRIRTKQAFQHCLHHCHTTH
jgi:hypothetical protein